MNPVNKVVLSRREYKDINDLYTAVAQQIRILLESGYIIVAAKDDELGDSIYIEYSIFNEKDSWPRPFWLMKNEMLSAADEHIDNEVSNAKEILATAEHADNIVQKMFGNSAGKKGPKGNDGNNGNCDA